MAEVYLSDLAREDLVDVWSYIAYDSENAADSVVDEITAILERLAENPALGRVRGDLGSELRSFPVKTYIVFYRPRQQGIEVARVLSGYRDLATLI